MTITAGNCGRAVAGYILPGQVSNQLITESELQLSRVRRLVLDVLKPHQPTILDLAVKLGDLEGIEGTDVVLNEIDNKVENIKITLEGSHINFDEVAAVVQESGGSIHSIDKVSTGRELIEEANTPQDISARWMR